MNDPSRRVEKLLAQYGHGEAAAAWFLCDRHPGDAIACTIVDIDPDGEPVGTDLTYEWLRTSSERFAAALADLGVRPGDRVATLIGKSPDLLTVLLGIWRLGAVYVPLFTAFGPQAIALRLADTRTKVVITDSAQLPKLAPGPDMPEAPPWKTVVAGDGTVPGGALSLAGLLATRPTGFPAHPGGADEPFVHMLTSGTTGRPKGVVHPFTYAAGWQVYLEYGLGVTPEDAYWCAADPGWAYGLYAALIAPLAAGIRTHLLTGRFSAEATWKTLATFGITNFAAAPTVFRSLRDGSGGPSGGPEDGTRGGLRLRRASSAGEPLTSDVNDWAEMALGVLVHDHYGQTEVGMVLGNHHHPDVAQQIKPGSMGRPLPGWNVAVLHNGADEPAPPGTAGRIAVEVRRSPLMTFRGYHGAESGGGRFTPDGHWYLTGDTGHVDGDGDFHFSARDDDVIIMAGYRIGPFDVESILLRHPAVADCAVIAVPDDVRGEVIEAVVATAPSHRPSDALAGELQRLVKERYAAHAYPRRIRFVNALPRTPSGKLQRYLLRADRPDQAGGDPAKP